MENKMQFIKKENLKKPLYCDDVPFELFNGDFLEPSEILGNDVKDIKKLEEALFLIRQYVQFLENEVVDS